MTCALRALNLCDGQWLEMPDRALEPCLTSLLERFPDLAGSPEFESAQVRRQELIERTLQAPPLPL